MVGHRGEKASHSRQPPALSPRDGAQRNGHMTTAAAEFLALLKDTPDWFEQPSRDRLARIRARDPDVFEPKDVHELVLARANPEPALVGFLRTAGRLWAQFEDLEGHDAVRRRVNEIQTPVARLRAIYSKAKSEFDPRVGELLRDNSLPTEARAELLAVLEPPKKKSGEAPRKFWIDAASREDGTLHLGDGVDEGVISGPRLVRLTLALAQKPGQDVSWRDVLRAQNLENPMQFRRNTETLEHYVRDIRKQLPEGLRYRFESDCQGGKLRVD